MSTPPVYVKCQNVCFYKAFFCAAKDIHPLVVTAQTTSPGNDFHYVQPGNYMLVQQHRRKDALKLIWYVPYQVLLTTHITVKCEGRPTWMHVSHCKKTAPPEDPKA